MQPENKHQPVRCALFCHLLSKQLLLLVAEVIGDARKQRMRFLLAIEFQ
jgi:hypothetical protein